MKKVNIAAVLVAVLLFFSVFPNVSEAHRGTLDKLGGHFQNSNCDYLLHSPTPLAKSAKTKTQLLSMIKTYSSNKCKNSLTVNKIQLTYALPVGTATAVPPAPKPVKAAASSALALHKTYKVTFYKGVDGDTAYFKINGKAVKTRFLFIDTPESTIQHQPFGKEASNYTTARLSKAKNITLETDGSNLYDKYSRLLAWVWVDGKLLQEDITKSGLVKQYYDYGTYKYENRIRTAMTYAKSHHAGIYK